MSLVTPLPLTRRRLVAARAARFDLLLPGAAVALALLGLLVIASGTRGAGGPSGYLARQALWVGLGAAVMVAAMTVDLGTLRRRSGLLWAAGLLGLLAVLSPLGVRTNGAQAWFGAGPVRLQPAELVKPVLIVALAAHGARSRARGAPTAGWLLGALAIAGPPLALVLLQPDLGTAGVLAFVTVAALVAAGARARHLAVVAVVGGLAAAGAVGAGAVAPYQVDRLTSFLHQGGDPTGATWNLEQAKIAIGSGGLVGQGPFAGKQTGLGYVPERHTDFVFTVVGEELGLAGGLSVVALFGVLAWRVWRAAWRAEDRFGSLLCAGVLAMIVGQAFENIGMAMGMTPITGIPLPFVSYGGSALLAAFAAVGLAANVSGGRRSWRPCPHR